MTIKRTELYQAQRLKNPLYSPNRDQAVTAGALATILTKAKADPKLGSLGAKAIEAAYDQAKAKAGANPTFAKIMAALTTAQSSLGNEKATGRINDGYVDDREAAASKNPVAKAVYAFLNKAAKAAAPVDANVKATRGQLGRALTKLNDAVSDAFKAFKAKPNGSYYDLTREMRSVASAKSLGKAGESTLVIATNGVTGRGDNGSLTDGGNSLPTEADVKKALKNAYTKLLAADGAKIVDFKKPNKAAVSKKDGTITGLEVDRTPAVQGKAAHAFLAFAAKL